MTTHARPALDLLDLDRDVPFVPRVGDAPARLDLLDHELPLLAVLREPLLELLRIGQGVPDLVERRLQHDLPRHLHDRLLVAQPYGLRILCNQTSCTLSEGAA